MRTGTLEYCHVVADGPHEEPIAYVADMTLVRSCPLSREPVHIVTTNEFLA